MNLYAITPSWAPEVRMWLAEDDQEAMSHGVYVAAHDAVEGHGSPSAHVYVVARDLELVGVAKAVDAPAEWPWAHPGVEENAADIARLGAELQNL